MDTIWTPEFAEAGWLRELKGTEQADALDDVLDGPKASVQWKNKTYAVPLNTNVQLLWYRKDLVPTPPETWDEMIAMAKKLPPDWKDVLGLKDGDHVFSSVKIFDWVRPETFLMLCKQAQTHCDEDQYFALVGVLVRQNGDVQAVAWINKNYTWKLLEGALPQVKGVFASADEAKQLDAEMCEKLARGRAELGQIFG